MPSSIAQPKSTNSILSITNRANPLSIPRLPQFLHGIAAVPLVGVVPHVESCKWVDGSFGRGSGGAAGARTTQYGSVLYEKGASSLGHMVHQKIERHAAFVVANVADLDDRAEGG